MLLSERSLNICFESIRKRLPVLRRKRNKYDI
nr:MAG TPA: hypothetical protein [Caudoviricetes sp.]